MSKDVKDYINIIGNRLGKAFSVDDFGLEEELEFWALSAEHTSRKKTPQFHDIIRWVDLLYNAPVHFVYKLQGENLILIRRQLLTDNLLPEGRSKGKNEKLDTKRAEFISDFEAQLNNLEKKRQFDEDFKEHGVSAHTIGNCEHIPLYKRSGEFWGIYVVGPSIKSPENMHPKFSIIGRLLSSWIIELDEEEKKSQQRFQDKIDEVIGELGTGTLSTKVISEIFLFYIINALKAKSGAIVEVSGDNRELICEKELADAEKHALLGAGEEAKYNITDAGVEITKKGEEFNTKYEHTPLLLSIANKSISGFIWVNRLSDNPERDTHKVLSEISKLEAKLFDFRDENLKFSDELMDGFYHMLRAIETNREKTLHHTPRLIAFAEMFGMLFGLDNNEMEILKTTAKLHDIGYVGAATISSTASYGTELAHPVAGATMINNLPVHEDVITGIKTHHEWVNGKGSPNGLTGEEIPWTGKIISVFEYIVDFIESNPEVPSEKEEEMVEKLKSNLIERADIQFDMVLIPTVIQQITMLGWSGMAELGVGTAD